MVLHGCGRCGGIFIDVEDSKRLNAAFPLGATALADKAAMVAREAPNLRQDVACPVCRRTMQRTRLGTMTLELDICAHGTWFDRDELRLAAEALHPPTPKSTVALGVAPPPENVYAKGLRALADMSLGLLDHSNDPDVLHARIARLERDLGRR